MTLIGSESRCMMLSDTVLLTDAANGAKLRRAARSGMMGRLFELLIPYRGSS